MLYFDIFCGECPCEHFAHRVQPFARIKLAHARHAYREALHKPENGVICVVIKLLYVRFGIYRTVGKSAHDRLRERAGVLLEFIGRAVYDPVVFSGVKERDLGVERKTDALRVDEEYIGVAFKYYGYLLDAA